MRLSRSAAIGLSGMIWFLIGAMLLAKGISCLISAVVAGGPLLDRVLFFSSSREQGALVLVALALLIGHAKARFALSKSVKRVVDRILSFKGPIPLHKIYTLPYLFLIVGMVGLGILCRWLPLDVRGLLDVAIGSALINGAASFIRLAFTCSKEST